MKKILFAVLALAMFAGQVSAQDTDARAERQRKKLEQNSVKQATQIAKDLDFTGELKDNFVVLYTEYQLALADAKLADVADRMSKREMNARTEEDIESDILARFASERKLIDIREQYYKEFRRILTPSQIEEVYAADTLSGDSQNGNNNMMMGNPGMMGSPGMGGPGMGGPGMGGPF